jgi:transposase
LLPADGVGTNEIMRQTGTSKTWVWRWQKRFVKEGVDGLLRDKTDKTRPSRVRPLGQDVGRTDCRLDTRRAQALYHSKT